MSAGQQLVVLALISPAKSLKDAKAIAAITKHLPPSRPVYVAKADVLAAKVKGIKAAEIAKTMSVSAAIAGGVVTMFANYQPAVDPTGANCHQAALLYDGPAYKGLSFETLTAAQAARATKTVRFLSGLYGLLKPADAIQPYRLEMSIAPKDIGIAAGPKSLAEYWSEDVTREINATLGDSSPAILLNIASEEYAKAIRLSSLNPKIKVISVRFEDGGKVKSAYAKRARGLMARYVSCVNVEGGKGPSGSTISIEQLKAFDSEGYSFSSRLSASDDSLLVFTRGEAQAGGKQKKQKTS